MKLKMKKRSLITVILAVVCATFLGITVSMLSGAVAKAQTAANQTGTNNIIVPELTLSDYGTRSDGAIFSGTALSQLYDALTGTSDGTATYAKVKNTVLGSDVSYGLSTSAANGVVPTIPAYKSAYDLYLLNGSKNILVDFGGQTWTVTFVTTDTSGDVIVTLWLSDAYKENGSYVRSAYGWYSNTSAANGTASATNYVSNMYSSSLIRVKTLNGGDVNGAATQYAQGSTTATTSTLNQTVSSADRVANPWAIYTLNNTALSGSAKANKSLVDYIDTPSQIKYTYYEDFNYHYNTLGGNGANSYMLNEAINKDLTGQITGSVGANTIRASYSNNAHQGQWYSSIMAAAANTNYTAVGYNDWAYDRIWLPSWSETGSVTYSTYYGMPGIWRTANTKTVQTGQLSTMNGTGVPVAWNGNQTTIDNSEYVWLRTGNTGSTYGAAYLTSGGAYYYALTARTLAVRPALHLNLTSAAQAAVTGASATDGYEVPVPTQAINEDFTGVARWMAEFSQIMQTANPTEPKYKWIDTTLHGNSSIVSFQKIMYTSKNSVGTSATTATDVTNLGSGAFIHAGSYQVTLELAAGYKWRGQALVANDATSRQYTFTITINQLEMKYDLAFYDQSNTQQSTNKCEYAGTTSAVAVKFNATSPATFPAGSNHPDSNSVTIYYLGTNAGNSFGASDNGGKGSTTGPTSVGSYKATLEDNTTQSDYKLTPNTAGGDTLPFQIEAKQVSLPTVTTQATDYNGSPIAYNFSSSYNKNFVQVTGVRVSAVEGGLTKNYILTFDSTSGTWYNQTGSGGRYEVTIDDTGSIAKVNATDAGDYQVEFGLVDTVNTTWATGSPTDKVATFTVNRAKVTVSFGAPSAAGFMWAVGDTGNLSVASITNVVTGEKVTVDLYWYAQNDTANTYTMYTTGVPDNTLYSISQFDSFGAGSYYLCAILSDDTSGINVNRNYVIDDTDPNTGDTGVTAKLLQITAGSATLDNIIWQYGTPTSIDQNVTGNVITYNKVSGVAVAYTVKAVNYPTSFTASYSNATKSDAGTYTTTLTLEIPASMQANQEMPDPSTGYTYLGEGYNYTYVNKYKCTIDFDWTIEQKEVDLSGISFEYSKDAADANDTSATWNVYNPSNPPEASGFDLFWIRIPATSLANTGITGAVAENYQNQMGPGVVNFDFNFTLDPNYKAQAGQNQTAMPYSMTTTGQQIAINWVRTLLTDANGDTVYDSNNIPYYVYELDTSNIPSSALPYIKYEYYQDAGSTYGSVINGGAVGNHNGMAFIIDPTGMNANSQNSTTVYVRPVLVGMTQINGVDPYVLVGSAAQPEYRKITVGDNRKAVDVTAGTLTSMTYGTTVSITDAYSLVDRTTSQNMPVNTYKVSLHDSNGEIAPDATSFDYSTLNAGNYTLVFEMVGTYDNIYVLSATSLPFTVEGIKLVAPTLKDGVTLVFSGADQYLENSLQNFDPEYMEFAPNSIEDAYHAGTYTAVINIKAQYAGNYVFVMPATPSSPTKSPARAALTDGTTGNSVQLSNGNATAALDWTIEKYVFDTTAKSAWNFATDGATLSYNGVPTTIKALTMGNEPRLIINVAYYDTDGNPLSDVELKGGDKYLVAAYLDPSSLDANDVEFKGQAYDPMTQQVTSPQTTYTVPQSGAAAFLSNIGAFMTKTWLGLPVWAWFVIGLAVLILLIIIIAVACKRRKSKEEKQAIKERKEEEKARKEEEKQRREEERRMQQERLDAERELAKAKQEAELEKIRAQAGMAAGAGMATMAVQQPQQAQAVQSQPAQQAQPVQQVDNTNNELLREMRAQMAEMRAENKATQAQMQAMQAMQYQQPMHYAQPQYAPAPAASAAAPADSNLMTLMDLKVQMAEMKSAQAVAEIKAAQAIAEAKAANRQDGNHPQSQQPVIVMAPASPFGGMGMNQQAMYSPNYPNYGGYPSVNMGYGMQALPAPQQMLPQYGMMPPYGYPPYGMMPPYGYPPVAMLPQPYAPAKAVKEEEEPVVTSTSQTTPSMTMSQPPYCPPGAVMTTTTTIDTSKADGGRAIKRTAADSADDVNFDVDGFYDPFN
ncbi:MAG: hypothetical protein K2J83_05815 [Clostridia bacterium]|nr:hypothetical protein [Clostridia bacterium]